MKETTFGAVLLAGGKGSRMKQEIPKQYILVKGKPLLYYSLYALEQSYVDDIVLVVSKGEEEYVQKEIVERYQIHKVKAIVPGGKERYHSVYQGLQSLQQSDYVLIHDGARPCLTQDILERIREDVKKSDACVAGMPVKDTVKIVNDKNEVIETPNRSYVWQVQTPQAFSYSLVKEAYDKLQEEPEDKITDDAMVVEHKMQHRVHLVEGSYENIKVTTPEDLVLIEQFLGK